MTTRQFYRKSFPQNGPDYDPNEAEILRAGSIKEAIDTAARQLNFLSETRAEDARFFVTIENELLDKFRSNSEAGDRVSEIFIEDLR